VELVRDGALWRGEVVPLDDAFSFYLVVRPRPDGPPAIVLRNPERNLGWQFRVDALRRTGDSVTLVSSTRENRVFAAGTLHDGTLTLDLGGWGGSYDFRRLEPGEASDFWPRGRPDAGWTYVPPPALGDGWRTGTLEEVGISRDSIAAWMRRLVREGDDSVTAPRIHSVLIARHGRLVLEEYFFGTGRDQPHDTRSAAKSLTSTLIGAAIEAGIPIRDTTRVYRVMEPGAFPGLEPRRRAMTVAHLMTQSSGLDCDDADPSSPGGEETMTGQTEEPDYAKYALALRMVRDPGTKTVYCSTQPNLAWAVLSRAAGRPLPDLVHDLLAAPLGMRRYWLPLTPAGDAYGGGGVRVLPREFLKLGELYLRGGRWNGRRVLPAAWARRATSPLTTMGNQGYGYLWWLADLPYRGRTVRAYYAAGNGGQTVMSIPELDLVIAIFAGNYADGRRTIDIQRGTVARDILPAVDPAR
jgi:CubicO group peptidase (beta-lactamase class C family)